MAVTSSIAEVRPGIFEIRAETFTATADAMAYDPDVRVSFPFRASAINCTSVYTRDDEDTPTAGVIRVSTDRLGPVDGERDAVRLLFAAVDAYVRPPCCGPDDSIATEHREVDRYLWHSTDENDGGQCIVCACNHHALGPSPIAAEVKRAQHLAQVNDAPEVTR